MFQLEMFIVWFAFKALLEWPMKYQTKNPDEQQWFYSTVIYKQLIYKLECCNALYGYPLHIHGNQMHKEKVTYACPKKVWHKNYCVNIK